MQKQPSDGSGKIKAHFLVFPPGDIRPMSPTLVRINVTIDLEVALRLDRALWERDTSQWSAYRPSINFSAYCRYLFESELKRVAKQPRIRKLSSSAAPSVEEEMERVGKACAEEMKRRRGSQ